MTNSGEAFGFRKYNTNGFASLTGCSVFGLPGDTTKTSAFASAKHVVEETSIFRFNELPPEIQNTVYRNLLLLEDSAGRRHCWPQILATSRNIKQEATGILYEENTACVTIQTTCVLPDPQDLDNHVVLINGNTASEQAKESFYRLEQWSGHLRRINSLEMHLDLTEAIAAPNQTYRGNCFFEHANRYLYSLCSFLQDKHSLKRLEVALNIRPWRDLELNRQQTLLNPIRKLGNLQSFTLTGASDGVTEYLLNLMTDYARTATGENPLKLWQTLAPQAVKVVALAAELDRDAVGVRGTKGHPHIYALRDAYLNVREKLEQAKASYDWTWEQDFEERVHLVRELMKGNALKELEEAVEAKIDRLRSSLAEVKQWEEAL